MSLLVHVHEVSVFNCGRCTLHRREACPRPIINTLPILISLFAEKTCDGSICQFGGRCHHPDCGASRRVRGKSIPDIQSYSFTGYVNNGVVSSGSLRMKPVSGKVAFRIRIVAMPIDQEIFVTNQHLMISLDRSQAICQR